MGQDGVIQNGMEINLDGTILMRIGSVILMACQCCRRFTGMSSPCFTFTRRVAEGHVALHPCCSNLRKWCFSFLFSGPRLFFTRQNAREVHAGVAS